MANIEKSSIDFDFKGIGNIILNHNLTVPFYQRSYSWEDKHVIDLFSDIINALNENTDVYFIGTIVTTQKNNTLEVIDGQQRLATISMLIAAIRDYFFRKKDNERSEQISGKYLRQRDLRSLDLIPKLKLNNNDNQFFCDFILRNPDEKERKSTVAKSSSNEKINRAYELLKEKLNYLISSDNDKSDNLISLVEFIHEKLKVVIITVTDDANAFTIFETLNDRGLSLAISDLLKNYIFGLSQDRLYEVQSNWTTMFNLLEAQEDKNIIIDFLRHFWSARYKLVREKDLYSEIKKSINSKSKAVIFSDELKIGSFNYISILQSESEYWATFSTKTKINIKKINKLGITQIRPLLLAIVTKFEKRIIDKTIEFVISFITRLLIHGGSGSGVMEENYCRAAQKIYNEEIKTLKQLKESLKNITPNNSTFQKAFSNASVSKNYLARFYLLSIENYLRKDNNSELYPSDDEELLNLEHILPQKYNNDWSNFSNEEHKEYYKKIGNLTLLANKLNSEVKSKKYTIKVKYYKKSELLLNKLIIKNSKWDKEEIENRQNELGKIAVKVWPV